MTVPIPSKPASSVPTGATPEPTVAVPAVGGAAPPTAADSSAAASTSPSSSPSWRWIVATVAFWGVCAALNELGGMAAQLGTAFAGLVTFAVLLTQGQAAVTNGVKLFT